jgi:O-antigen ligase
LYEQPASLRPNATFQEPMIFAHFLLAGMPLLASLFLARGASSPSERHLSGVSGAMMLLVMAVALILTIGRAAWLGALASAVVLLAANTEHTRRRAILMLIVGCAVALSLFVIAMGSPITAWHTVANRFNLQRSNVSAEQRLWFGSLIFELTRKYPLLGVGYGNYPLYQLSRFDLTGIAGAYGVWWQSLVETGLVGVLSLTMMLLIPIRLIIRAIRLDPEGPWRPYLVGWMASLTGLYVGYLFMGDRLNLYVWTTLGFAMASVKVAAEHRARS